VTIKEIQNHYPIHLEEHRDNQRIVKEVRSDVDEIQDWAKWALRWVLGIVLTAVVAVIASQIAGVTK
jgi:hypothetical protein